MDPKGIRLIALYSSVPQSGKSEVRKLLPSFIEVKFAAPLKGMVRLMFKSMGFDDVLIERMVEGDLKEQIVPGLSVTPRHIMVTIGTQWGREMIDNDLWQKIGSSKIESLFALGCNAVVDDMRFPNEYDAIRKLGGTCIRIIRPDASGANVCEGHLDGHHFDAVIFNDGSLEDLHNAAAYGLKALNEGCSP